MIEITKEEFEEMKTTLIEEEGLSGVPTLRISKDATVKGEPVQSDMEVLIFNSREIAFGETFTGYFVIEDGDIK